MKERPLLLRAPMVCATLDGRKTNTRRMNGLDVINKNPDNYYNPFQRSPSVWYFLDKSQSNGSPTPRPIQCPYGVPGDRLWVRETWRTSYNLDDVRPRDLREGAPIEYMADNTLNLGGIWRKNNEPMIDVGRTRSSIFMPRWASRILLEITDIRVERVQDISEEDAIAEGIPPHNGGKIHHRVWQKQGPITFFTARKKFSVLWESINGPGSWDKNPWVWVVKFLNACIRL